MSEKWDDYCSECYKARYNDGLSAGIYTANEMRSILRLLPIDGGSEPMFRVARGLRKTGKNLALRDDAGL